MLPAGLDYVRHKVNIPVPINIIPNSNMRKFVAEKSVLFLTGNLTVVQIKSTPTRMEKQAKVFSFIFRIVICLGLQVTVCGLAPAISESKASVKGRKNVPMLRRRKRPRKNVAVRSTPI
jgi:hypothetical protein